MAVVWLGEGDGLDPEVVGGKASSIDSMLRIGLPVPPAFVLTTDLCRRFHDAGGHLDEQALAALHEGLARLQEATGRVLGDAERPLLVSVRSGAARSMPGMMDTILNLGMTDAVQATLAARSGDAAYAADTARRFAEQFDRVVGSAPPADPAEQLLAAVGAVFGSWHSPRATAYREHHGISHEGGTSVTVQAMVFGNLDDTSGTGVLFTRDPLTGAPEPYGEWLPRGQGEDVVSGRFDALPLDRLRDSLPEVHHQLLQAAATLEQWGRDVQDMEFTVESGVLHLLQTRAAKRSPDAAVRLAVAMHEEGLLTRDEALERVTPEQVSVLLRPRVAPEERARATVLVRGEPACPGVGHGRVVTSCEDAEDASDEGHDVVLVRPTTDPDDVSGMILASAIVTEIGGATSHAAVVSRELGTPCVVGCGPGALAALEGREVTVDGTLGEVYDGVLSLAPCTEQDNPALAVLGAWARERTGTDGALPEVLARARALAAAPALT